MGPSENRVSRRVAVRRLAAASVAAVSGLAVTAPRSSASSFGSAGPAAVERLRLGYMRDPELTGADELRFIHGSTSHLEPAIGAWFVLAHLQVNPHAGGLLCSESESATTLQRMRYAGDLPNRCRGRVSVSGQFVREANPLAEQFVRPGRKGVFLSTYFDLPPAEQAKQVLVLAGSRSRFEACVAGADRAHRNSALLHVQDSALHVAIFGAAIASSCSLKHALQAGRIEQVDTPSLHATILAVAGVNPYALAHRQEGRVIRPFAARGRVVASLLG